MYKQIGPENEERQIHISNFNKAKKKKPSNATDCNKA